MNPPPRHETPEGYALIELDVDLFGRVAAYAVEGTRYEVVRTPAGWRARLAARGNARRSLQGPPWEDPRQALRYLKRYGYLSGDSCHR